MSPAAYNGRLNGEEARVCIIEPNRAEEMSLKKEMGEVLSSQGKEMGEINLTTLSTQMSVMMEEA